MSNIITIKSVRAYMDENGTAQINLEDAARGLGFTRVAASGNDVIRWERIDKHLTDFGFMPTSGHDGFIPESIFYLLAMKANNETAKRFQMQVATDILPSIRKHGAYMTPDTLEKALTSPDFLIQLATKLKEERAARVEAETKLQIAQPKADTLDNMTNDEGQVWTFTEAAKIMALPDVNSNTLRRMARENGWLLQEKNEATAHAVRSGLLRMIVRSVWVGNREKMASVPVIRPKAYDQLYRQIKRAGLF